jgi:hypothetical protein
MRISRAPVVIAQGPGDVIMSPNPTRAYADFRGAAGQRLTYWTFAERDHATIVQPGAARDGPLASWTRESVSGAPQSEGCTRQSF